MSEAGAPAGPAAGGGGSGKGGMWMSDSNADKREPTPAEQRGIKRQPQPVDMYNHKFKGKGAAGGAPAGPAAGGQ
jgi:hypothetical protein